ncbi:MAG TPA: hypothetical protein VIC07_04450 [Acidimicrobiia bacterium]|jgi:hypothetical protein
MRETALERIETLRTKVRDLERVVGRQNELLAELQHQIGLLDARTRPGPASPDLAEALARRGLPYLSPKSAGS